MSEAQRTCEGTCEEHSGDVRRYRVVAASGFDWGFMDYCDVAASEDVERGFAVELIEEPAVSEALPLSAEALIATRPSRLYHGENPRSEWFRVSEYADSLEAALRAAEVENERAVDLLRQVSDIANGASIYLGHNALIVKDIDDFLAALTPTPTQTPSEGEK